MLLIIIDNGLIFMTIYYSILIYLSRLKFNFISLILVLFLLLSYTLNNALLWNCFVFISILDYIISKYLSEYKISNSN
jgi:hypothetical protein